MPAHAKLLCPEGNDLKPSSRFEVSVQIVQDVRPYSGFWVPGGGTQLERSGRQSSSRVQGKRTGRASQGAGDQR
jgi:hypothetical protein